MINFKIDKLQLELDRYKNILRDEDCSKLDSINSRYEITKINLQIKELLNAINSSF